MFITGKRGLPISTFCNDETVESFAATVGMNYLFNFFQIILRKQYVFKLESVV